jgi:YbgC/YbaW family acyl-CoA thioester hydrolase
MTEAQPSRFRVRSYELDALGHLNHAVFLNYFEQARFDALESVGIQAGDLAREGWGVHVVRVEVDYRRECVQGDRLLVRTRVEAMRNSSMVLRQVLVKEGSGDVAAEARIVAVWVQLGKGPARIPEMVRSALIRLGAPER